MEEKELRDILGKNLKAFRFRRQFSQSDLAEKANISVTYLSNIERGNNFPQPATLCSLANALEIGVWELFKVVETDESQQAIISRISADFTKHVNIALAEVTKRYNS